MCGARARGASTFLVLSVLFCADMFCCVSFPGRDGCFWVMRTPELRWILLVQAVSSLLPHWNLQLHLCHKLSCVVTLSAAFIVTFALLCLWLGLSLQLVSFSQLKNYCPTEGGSSGAGLRSLLMLLLRPASRCCLAREKMCACSGGHAATDRITFQASVVEMRLSRWRHAVSGSVARIFD